MKKQKRTKYNNGGLLLRQTFGNVLELEANARGNQNYQSVEGKAKINYKDTQAYLSHQQDSFGNTTHSRGISYTNPNRNISMGLSYSKPSQGDSRYNFNITKRF